MARCYTWFDHLELQRGKKLKSIIEEYTNRRGNDFKGWLLGDCGYLQREILMVPLLSDELTAKEKRYNSTHKKCRCCVERAIGVLKSRFRCLCKKTGAEGGSSTGNCRRARSSWAASFYITTAELEIWSSRLILT